MNPALWVREDGTITATLPGQSPIKLDRNGFPIYRRYEDPDTSPTDATFDLSYYTDADLAGDTNTSVNAGAFVDVAYGTNSSAAIDRTLEHFESVLFDGNGGDGGSSSNAFSAIGRVRTGTNTTINAVIVSAFPPFRINHTNGGLPNFLRFLESWRDGSDNETTFRFGGSLVQLNFSTYTAPHTHDEREPGRWDGTDGGIINFYLQPNRLWGYDPALLYAPASPVARRFATPGTTRSEFYREVATDDPYILNLRCAFYDSNGNGTIQTNGTDSRIDPKATCP